MSAIIVEASNFRGAYARLNGRHRIQVTYRSFLRAALTVGFPSWSEVWQSGWPVWLVQLCFGVAGRGALKSHQGDLGLRRLNHDLDQSERSPLSYKQGMVFTKLVAEELLDVPWLANVDALRRNGDVETATGTEERGDLVGRGQDGTWHVLEAKGRTHGIDRTLIAKAKRQAANIVRVRQRTPETTSACISCLGEVPIRVLLDDPEPEPKPEGDEREQVLNFEEGRLWGQYYGGLASYLQLAVRLNAVTERAGYVLAPLLPLARGRALEQADEFSPEEWAVIKQHHALQIGLPADIVENPFKQPNTRLFAEANGDHVGKDGIMLLGDLPDWDDEE